MDLELPWGAWYGEGPRAFPVPDGWQLAIARQVDAPALDAAGLRARFAQPHGAPTLAELARGRRAAVVVIDDLTRPTPTAELLPLVLDELARGGVPRQAVRVLVALGCHRPLARGDLIKKMGPLADELEVLNHNPYEQLVSYGVTAAGSPILINRWYAEAPLRVALGSVGPHPLFGYSGGAKAVFPGLAGIESIYQNHRPHHLERGLFDPSKNQLRRDAEEAVAQVGLDAIVNVVVNGERRIAGLFVGDFIAAHRAAVAFAESIYTTPTPSGCDALLFNAYPKDTDLCTIGGVLNPAAARPLLLPHQVAILTTAASDGPGYHALLGRGGRLYHRPPHRLLVGRRTIFFSPGVQRADVPPIIPDEAVLARRWSEVVEQVESWLGPRPSLGVLPTAPLQLTS
jgi:nickel-dependent lactate racemase